MKPQRVLFEPYAPCDCLCCEHKEPQETFYCGRCWAWLCPKCELERGDIKDCCFQSIMAWLTSFPFGANI